MFGVGCLVRGVDLSLITYVLLDFPTDAQIMIILFEYDLL